MNRLLAIAPALLVLAGCNKGPNVVVTNASPDEVQAKVAAAGGTPMEPGRWDAVVTVHKMTMPGLTPQAEAQVKARFDRPETLSSCVTAQDLKANRAPFLNLEDKSCRYDRFAMAGGKIDAKMTCTEHGDPQVATMNGNYGRDSYHMDMASDMMSMTVEAKRIGACSGK